MVYHQLLEFSLSGAITSTTDVNVSRLYRYSDDKYLLLYFVVQVLVAVVWLHHIVLQIMQVCSKSGAAFFLCVLKVLPQLVFVVQMGNSRDIGYLKTVYGWIDIFIGVVRNSQICTVGPIVTQWCCRFVLR